MKLQIDEKRKEIELIEPCTIKELFEFMSSCFESDYKDFKIVPRITFVDRIQYPVQPFIPQEPIPYPLYPSPTQPPYYVTCDTNNK